MSYNADKSRSVMLYAILSGSPSRLAGLQLRTKDEWGGETRLVAVLGDAPDTLFFGYVDSSDLYEIKLSEGGYLVFKNFEFKADSSSLGLGYGLMARELSKLYLHEFQINPFVAEVEYAGGALVLRNSALGEGEESLFYTLRNSPSLGVVASPYAPPRPAVSLPQKTKFLIYVVE